MRFIAGIKRTFCSIQSVPAVVKRFGSRLLPGTEEIRALAGRDGLRDDHVIANHILVSFHAAFILSVFSLAGEGAVFNRAEVLKHFFGSWHSLIDIAFWYITFHTGIAIHEMGHYLKAVKLNALNSALLPEAQKKMEQDISQRILWYIKMFIRIPWGKFEGVERVGLNYYSDNPYNLAVSAAGPAISRILAMIALPLGVVGIALGLGTASHLTVYAGRLIVGIGAVGLLDFLFADKGKYKEFKEREKAALKKATGVASKITTAWSAIVGKVKEMMIETRMQTVTLPGGRMVLTAPWQYRNSMMGGRHTEKQFPKSNVSAQEGMFVIQSAKNYEEAQEMTVALQDRCKEIVENAEGCSIFGVGLEGGLAPYIKKEPGDKIPVQRVWRIMKQAILDCGYEPGKDVTIAIDPAASEMSIAYREAFDQPDAIGMYLFWRDADQVVLSNEQLVDIYKQAIDEDVPIVSIEDGHAEDDHEGWKMMMKELNDKVFVIGDDSVTTRDTSIEAAADAEENNTALIKANQIGTLSECLLAMLVALGKGLQLVVSHRSKSPIDDMEAQIALASNSMGLKTGGGQNTERTHKYGTVARIMKEAETKTAAVGSAKEDVQAVVQKAEGGKLTREELKAKTDELISQMAITRVIGYEESTNAGIPTGGVKVTFGILGDEKYESLWSVMGATPLGTSAGTGEAIHYVDSIIEKNELTGKYPQLFAIQEDKTYRFKKELKDENISSKSDEALSALWHKANRYDGKGCLNVVEHIDGVIAEALVGKKLSELEDVVVIDRALLALELAEAIKRGKIADSASDEEKIDIMQRKGNLGMNALLSVSLALARLVAHLEGKELWQFLREQMNSAMANAIAANGGIGLLEGKVEEGTMKRVKKASTQGGKELWQVLVDEMNYAELVTGLQAVEAEQKNNSSRKSLTQIIREQLPVYAVQ